MGSYNPPPSRSSILAGTLSSLQSMWDLTIHPLRGLTSSLVLVLLSNRCGISQSTPFKAKQPGWYSFFSPIDVGSHNPPPLRPSILAGTHSTLQSMWDLTIHPLRGLVSSLILVLLSNRCGISQSTTFKAKQPRGTRYFLQSMWDLTIHPLQGPNNFAGTRSSFQSMWDLTIHRYRDLDPR